MADTAYHDMDTVKPKDLQVGDVYCNLAGDYYVFLGWGKSLFPKLAKTERRRDIRVQSIDECTKLVWLQIRAYILNKGDPLEALDLAELVRSRRAVVNFNSKCNFKQKITQLRIPADRSTKVFLPPL